MRTILKFIIILIIIIFFFRKKDYIKNIENIEKPDIILSPSGYYGFYTLGICHYIKTHFSIENKKIFGFSSGSFNGLYLTINNKEKRKKLLKMLLKMGKYNNLNEMSVKFKKNIIKKFEINDFNKNLYIGLTHFKQMCIYNNFNSINELIDCCYGSSFIPFVTINKMMYFYNKKLTVDGVFYYRKIKHISSYENKILLINPKMFGRYKKTLSIRNIFKPKCGINLLFLFGYYDAKKNHNILKHYLE
jgi:hypothetical protein